MDMLCILVFFLLSFNFISSFEIKIPAAKDAGKQHEPAASLDSGVQRGKRQINFTPIIPDKVKDEFKQYARNYLNSMVTEISDKKTEEEEAKTKRAQICAEVCQHRCLPSCEWSCCIKENIEEYRSAHLVKPLVADHATQRESYLATADENARNVENERNVQNERNEIGNKRAHFAKLRENREEVVKDGHECNPSCKRYCVPSCRFACCQPVQVKGVLLF